MMGLFPFPIERRRQERELEMEINALRSELAAERIRASALAGILESLDVDGMKDELFALRLENASLKEIFLRQERVGR